MKRSVRPAETILEDLLSRDPQRIWSASCEVIHLGQERTRILPLVPYLTEIGRAAEHTVLGGGLAPDRRFVDMALRTIRFHRDSEDCPCCLYPLPGDDGIFDPQEEMERGYVRILDRMLDEHHTGDYLVQCTRCGRTFQIIQEWGHFVWWRWTPIS